MKNKLIIRIIGALASALIIVSVFVPFVNVTGYSPSLWETFQITDSLYLPIMIIVFGAIGVVFFSLNIKTEFAYMSTGAVAFFVIMRTIDILNQGAFNTLSFGYYFLVVGAILTGVAAFLNNLKSNKKIESKVTVESVSQPSMIDQIDKLYNDQSAHQSEISPIQPVDGLVQPIPVQPIETVTSEQPVSEMNQGQVQPAVEPQVVQEPVMEQPINPVIQEFNNPVNPVVQEKSDITINPVIEEPIQQIPVIEPQVVQEPVIEQPINPVIQEFNNPVNPVVQEKSDITINPVIEEPIQQIPVIEPQVVQEPVMEQPINPVIQEFTNPSSTSAPQQSNELDIFGQPLNK